MTKTKTRKPPRGFPSKPFKLTDVKKVTSAEWAAQLRLELAEKIAMWPDEALLYKARYAADRKRRVADAKALAFWEPFKSDAGR